MVNDELTERIIGCAYEVHNTIGFGLLEKVYENSLVYELKSYASCESCQNC
jgi:GxxExxY protein